MLVIPNSVRRPASDGASRWLEPKLEDNATHGRRQGDILAVPTITTRMKSPASSMGKFAGGFLGSLILQQGPRTKVMFGRFGSLGPIS